MNFKLKVKEILKETYILTGKINNEHLIKNLIEFVRKTKDDKLSYKTNVKGHFTGFKSLIQNNYFITFLKDIQPQIKIIYPDNFIISEAWGNICKKGEEVTEHDHSAVDGFCGILYLTEGGPGTYFKEYDLLIKEEIGKYILFHPLLKHSVQKIENNIERITIAFNMNQIKQWEDYSETIWVNKK
jgi:hypothetical protein